MLCCFVVLSRFVVFVCLFWCVVVFAVVAGFGVFVDLCCKVLFV